MKSLIFTFLFVSSISLFSQSVVALADKTEIQGDEMITLTLKITGDIQGDPQLPELKDWNIIGGPNHASRVTVINGKIDKSSNISYYLTPKKTGTLEIPPITFKENGNALKTKSISVNVTGDIIKERKKHDIPQQPIFVEPEQKKRKSYKL
jgi:hypothetical protein